MGQWNDENPMQLVRTDAHQLLSREDWPERPGQKALALDVFFCVGWWLREIISFGHSN